MVVQFILKGLFFYFLFLFVRSFFKSSTVTNRGTSSAPNRPQAPRQAKPEEDIVEAEFRRL